MTKLQSLRTRLRENSKDIIDQIFNNYLKRENGKAIIDDGLEMCMFCSSTVNITKEHVMPRWAFEKSVKKHFVTNINGLSQTYNKTTIPACLVCNSDILNSLEKYIQRLFTGIDLKTDFFTNQEIENIIRWLEIIDYKFQILNIQRKFLASKESGYIPYLADFPVSMLRSNKDSPSKVISEIRRSQKRITVKAKTKNVNSLVVFKTSNPDFYFFHTMDDFIFLELPKYKVAVFYFYNKVFGNAKDAHEEAMKIIDEVY